MKQTVRKHRVNSVKKSNFAITSVFATCILLTPTSLFAAFGVTSNSGEHTVDTGAGLVYKINSNGDIKSIKLNGGTELNTPTPSGVNSGFGATSVSVSGVIDGNKIRITCINGDSLHYYLVKSGENIIYMATYASYDTEWRFIPRLINNVFNIIPVCSDYSSGGTDIESADTILLNGITVSKYYGNKQMKDDSNHGASGTAGTATMWMGNREKSSGGPFFRDIQVSGDSNMSAPYNYMKSGHAQTEPFRPGLHGIYALSFGGTPDFGTQWDTVGLQGYRKAVDRGYVVCNGITGMNSNFTYTVAFSNPSNQYWVSGISGGGSGSFSTSKMSPGTYAMTIYKGELAVYSENVTVNSGAATTLPTRTISNDPNSIPMIWRLGQWDGTPLEFMNSTNCLTMHPSDARNSSWGPKTIAATAPSNTWPCYMFKGVNDGCKITFTLTASQVAAHTIRIGLTAATGGARPQIKVNSWNSSTPSSSTQPNSRILTIGTYRGNNITYTYSVPASAFVTGSNTLSINCVSGSSYDPNWPWTGPAISFDCIQLDN